jgi:hypothetical protein
MMSHRDPNIFSQPDDINEKLEDGRIIQLYAGGTEIPMAVAVRLGFVKGAAKTGPSETKVFTPSGTKTVTGETQTIDLAKMKKPELVEHATGLGLTVGADDTVATIKAAIEAHNAQG